MVKLVRISAEAFNKIPLYGMEESVIAIGRLVLVDGFQQKEVANAHGISRQRVSKIVGSIVEAYNRQVHRPGNSRNSIVSLEMELPEVLAYDLVMLTEKILSRPDLFNEEKMEEIQRTIRAMYEDCLESETPSEQAGRILNQH